MKSTLMFAFCTLLLAGTVCASPGAKQKKKPLVCLEAETVIPFTRTIEYYTRPRYNGVVQQITVTGQKITVAIRYHGVLWIKTGKNLYTASFLFPNLIRKRVRQYGKLAIEKKCGWNPKVKGFEAWLHQIRPFGKKWQKQQPQSLQMEYLYQLGRHYPPIHTLRLYKKVVFRGTLYNVYLTPKAANGDSTLQCSYYQNPVTGIIGRVDIMEFPSASSPAPPTRSIEYIAFIKHIAQIPPALLRFPPHTHVIVPGCMGSIPLPPGVKLLKLSPDKQYLGYSIKQSMDIFTATFPNAKYNQKTGKITFSAHFLAAHRHQ